MLVRVPNCSTKSLEDTNMPPLAAGWIQRGAVSSWMIFTIIRTRDLGVKNTPSSEATTGANLLRKYS